jgi:hypothetical protein
MKAYIYIYIYIVNGKKTNIYTRKQKDIKFMIGMSICKTQGPIMM